jgi:D-alanine-D-alanine ligase
MTKKNIVLAMGGGSDEHEVSLRSAEYIATQIDTEYFNLYQLELTKNKKWMMQGQEVSIGFDRIIRGKDIELSIDAVIPCFHGYPGETGDIQSFFEMIELPYIGCTSETSRICFNKVLTKLWMSENAIPNTPFKFVTELSEKTLNDIEDFFDREGPLFIKASNQGSSVGCYPTPLKKDIKSNIESAFRFSPYVVIEKMVDGRELEVSAYEYEGEVQISRPGEILCSGDKFYSYDEKYSQKSQTTTHVVAQNISEADVERIRKIARDAFRILKLRHLTRIDFFLCHDGTIYLNEPNTFPGMTEISLFPQMMEENGHKFKDFLTATLNSIIK